MSVLEAGSPGRGVLVVLMGANRILNRTIVHVQAKFDRHIPIHFAFLCRLHNL